MVYSGLLILIFIIGYLSYMKKNNGNYTIPELKIQIHIVLHKLNDTLIPSAYFSVRNQDSDGDFNSKFSKKRYSKETNTETFHSNLQTEDDGIQILDQEIEKFQPSENIKNEDYDLKETLSLNDDNYQLALHTNNISKDGDKFLTVTTTVEDSKNLVIINETKVEDSDCNNTALVPQNTTILLEVNENIPDLTITSITDEIYGILEDDCDEGKVYETHEDDNWNQRSNFNYTNISAEFLSGWLLESGQHIQNRINKLPNGVYLAINPYISKKFEISNVISYELVTRNKKLVSTIVKFLVGKTTKDYNLIETSLDNSLQTAMGVYYEDMSLLDYSISVYSDDGGTTEMHFSTERNKRRLDSCRKDVIKFAFCPNSVFLCVIIVICGFIFIKLLKVQSFREKLPRLPCLYFGTGKDVEYTMTRDEITNLVLEMKEIQNDSLFKVENNLHQTNEKLQYLLQKLVLVEEYVMGSNVKETQDTLQSIINFSKSNHRLIKELKTEQIENANLFNDLSLNLDKTKRDLEHLKSDYKNISESQIDLLKKIAEIKLHLKNYIKPDFKKGVENEHNFLETKLTNGRWIAEAFRAKNFKALTNQSKPAKSLLNHEFIRPSEIIEPHRNQGVYIFQRRLPDTSTSDSLKINSITKAPFYRKFNRIKFYVKASNRNAYRKMRKVEAFQQRRGLSEGISNIPQATDNQSTIIPKINQLNWLKESLPQDVTWNVDARNDSDQSKVKQKQGSQKEEINFVTDNNLHTLLDSNEEKNILRVNERNFVRATDKAICNETINLMPDVIVLNEDRQSEINADKDKLLNRNEGMINLPSISVVLPTMEDEKKLSESAERKTISLSDNTKLQSDYRTIDDIQNIFQFNEEKEINCTVITNETELNIKKPADGLVIQNNDRVSTSHVDNDKKSFNINGRNNCFLSFSDFDYLKKDVNQLREPSERNKISPSQSEDITGIELLTVKNHNGTKQIKNTIEEKQILIFKGINDDRSPNSESEIFKTQNTISIYENSKNMQFNNEETLCFPTFLGCFNQKKSIKQSKIDISKKDNMLQKHSRKTDSEPQVKGKANVSQDIQKSDHKLKYEKQTETESDAKNNETIKMECLYDSSKKNNPSFKRNHDNLLNKTKLQEVEKKFKQSNFLKEQDTDQVVEADLMEHQISQTPVNERVNGMQTKSPDHMEVNSRRKDSSNSEVLQNVQDLYPTFTKSRINKSHFSKNKVEKMRKNSPSSSDDMEAVKQQFLVKEKMTMKNHSARQTQIEFTNESILGSKQGNELSSQERIRINEDLSSIINDKKIMEDQIKIEEKTKITENKLANTNIIKNQLLCNKILEANPLFKKQMDQHFSNENITF